MAVNKSKIEGLSFFSPKQNEAGNTEAYFSRSSCDTCNTTLGGDRYEVVCHSSEPLGGTAKHSLIELECCIDCYLELCS